MNLLLAGLSVDINANCLEPEETFRLKGLGLNERIAARHLKVPRSLFGVGALIKITLLFLKKKTTTKTNGVGEGGGTC